MGLRAGPQGSGGAQSSLTPSPGGETAATEHAVEVLGLRLIEGYCRRTNRVDFAQGDLHRRSGADLVDPGERVRELRRRRITQK
jgi:hypothetical protein